MNFDTTMTGERGDDDLRDQVLSAQKEGHWSKGKKTRGGHFSRVDYIITHLRSRTVCYLDSGRGSVLEKFAQDIRRKMVLTRWRRGQNVDPSCKHKENQINDNDDENVPTVIEELTKCNVFEIHGKDSR